MLTTTLKTVPSGYVPVAAVQAGSDWNTSIRTVLDEAATRLVEQAGLFGDALDADAASSRAERRALVGVRTLVVTNENRFAAVMEATLVERAEATNLDGLVEAHQGETLVGDLRTVTW